MKAERVLGPLEKDCTLTWTYKITGQTVAVEGMEMEDRRADLVGQSLDLRTTRAVLFVERRGTGKEIALIGSTTNQRNQPTLQRNRNSL